MHGGTARAYLYAANGGGAFVNSEGSGGDPKFALGDVTRARRLRTVNYAGLS